jgi:hypothetical protein
LILLPKKQEKRKVLVDKNDMPAGSVSAIKEWNDWYARKTIRSARRATL